MTKKNYRIELSVDVSLLETGNPISNLQRYTQLRGILKKTLAKIEANEREAEEIQDVMDDVWKTLSTEEREEINVSLRCGMDP